MGVAIAYSAQLIGLKPEVVDIEVDISNGLNAFSIVGLGDRSVSEAKDRISAAIKNSDFRSPKQKNQKVVISLAPADIKKEGPSFDLAMAIAYLTAADDIRPDLSGRLFFGELSLEGNVRKIDGLLPILCEAQKLGFHTAYIPKDNAKEASLARNIKIFTISSLIQTIQVLSDESTVEPLQPCDMPDIQSNDGIDISSVRGNEIAKRALEIAAAGYHNIVMRGLPGTGKTMLARSLASILPPLTYEQSVEVTGIHSVARILSSGMILHPPFRSPHHTASYPSIVGGGTFPRPGEITLAHRGVLFLDEFPEFNREVIEALRQPLEDGLVTISRAKGVIAFPARCMLVASMNPCPCGKAGTKDCVCSAQIVTNYKKKISGPIADRIDIWVEVNKVDYDQLSERYSRAEKSSSVRSRIEKARGIQKKRLVDMGINKDFNSEMSAGDIEKCIVMSDDAKATLSLSAQKFGLSGRAFHRVMKVARTIADLSVEENISREHVLEALQYREK